MADTSQVERQLYILALLSENHRGYTLDDIINSLDRVGISVSRKTIERDIDYITENFFVYEEEKKGKTYYYASKYSLENISFNIMELISLYFIREVLKSFTQIDVGNVALKLIDRIVESSRKIDRSYVASLNEIFKVNIPVNNCEKGINSQFLSTIRKAIENMSTLYIEYFSFSKNEISKREFDPYYLEIQGNCYHIVGFCHLRNEIRDLRVSRIKQLELTDKTFRRPDNFYETYNQQKFDKLAGKEKIRLKLKFTGNAARYIKEYESFRADIINECDNGNLIFERVTTMTPDIVEWVLKYGDEVEVIEPKKLRELIIIKAQNILKKYKIF